MARTKARSASKPARAALSEMEILNTLLPALVAKATGQKLVDKQGAEVDVELDPAMVDRVLKVLELRQKFQQAEKAPRGKPGGPSWREPQA